jgi:hypothetical protein
MTSQHYKVKRLKTATAEEAFYYSVESICLTSISFKSCSCSNSIRKTSCQKSTIKVLDITPGLTAILTTVESLGRSQVVRQRVLVPPSLGSNPSAPVQNKSNRTKLKTFNFQISLQVFLDLKVFSQFFIGCD